MSSKFDCQMECDRFADWCIRITHNGYQWQAISIESISEAKKVIGVLEQWVRQQEIKESAPTDA